MGAYPQPSASKGQVTLVAGVATVANLSVLSSTNIFLTVAIPGGTVGFLRTTITPGVGFTINSDDTEDTSVVNWVIL